MIKKFEHIELKASLTRMISGKPNYWPDIFKNFGFWLDSH